ncbi:MAG: hypothetical protein LBO65_03240 [Spirochaetaceae bacterium]|nr:hypothetical protein [Spirochaetaceae bacterium]
MFLASCGGGKSALAGRWLLIEGNGFSDVELLKDGTGIADGMDVTWKVEKNRIYVSTSQQAMSFDYQLEGSKLTLTGDDGDTFVFLRPGGSSALVGKWVSTNEFLFERVEFLKDGSGKADGGNFKWAADKNKLFIIDFEDDYFEYEVSGSTLTITFDGEVVEQLKKE